MADVMPRELCNNGEKVVTQLYLVSAPNAATSIAIQGRPSHLQAKLKNHCFGLGLAHRLGSAPRLGSGLAPGPGSAHRPGSTWHPRCRTTKVFAIVVDPPHKLQACNPTYRKPKNHLSCNTSCSNRCSTSMNCNPCHPQRNLHHQEQERELEVHLLRCSHQCMMQIFRSSLCTPNTSATCQVHQVGCSE